MGLLAPEIVAWNAWEQRLAVKDLTKRLREIYERRYNVEPLELTTWRDRLRSLRQNTTRGLQRTWRNIKVGLLLEAGDLQDSDDAWRDLAMPDTPQLEWSDLHSWYALMGGFAFDTTSAETPFLPDGRKRVVLTPDGLVALFEHWPHLVPNLSQADIEDKSKADVLVKLITCWQALWFCIQCISRLAQGLSISLLELNVFGHAICALFIYSLWWSKPKDVQEPTKLVGDEADAVAALLTTLSPLGQGQATRQALERVSVFKRLKIFIGWNKPPEVDVWTPAEPSDHSCSLPPLAIASYAIEEVVYPGTIRIGDTHWTLRGRFDEAIDLNVAKHLACSTLVDKTTVARLKKIQHHDKVEALRPQIGKPIMPYILGRNRNWWLADNVYDRIFDQKSFGLSAGIVSFLYGGLHVTAWNAGFPTNVEQLLWRSSSLTVALALIAFAMFLTALDGVDWISDHAPEQNSTRGLRKLLDWIGRTFAVVVFIVGPFIVFPWYVFCRVFLVVESFINVAHLSAADLRVPSWSQYVPHVT